ncbi:hypothetical protein O181_026888 [Austropuccinia psidii MF-1]|uniref:Uncharacterized protein n=1 Tax=Austropuccinia psidii MF-1 TaxID=1389203 RepID=A0A9Q3CNF5_9BASI|nr:hypothetical protein [Austropuccinia psidii MF-1]
MSQFAEKTQKQFAELQESHERMKTLTASMDKIVKTLQEGHAQSKPQGHVMDNLYHQDDIKPDSMLMNKTRSPSQYQDGNNMSYSEKESLKQLPEVSSWPKFTVTGEYDFMELIDYIDGLFIDVPSIPDYWITSGLNTEFKGHASIWYTEIKEIHGRRSWP